jgi:hypothetical protein
MQASTPPALDQREAASGQFIASEVDGAGEKKSSGEQSIFRLFEVQLSELFDITR